MSPSPIPPYYSNTRVSHFRRCRHRYWYNYMTEGSGYVASALRRGAAGHEAIAAYYKGATPEEAIAIGWKTFDPRHSKILQDWLILENVLDRYFQHAQQHDRWDVISVEQRIEVELNGILLLGIFDLLVSWQGGIWIVDHKLNRRVDNRHLPFDSQVSFYSLMAQLAGFHIQGVVYNVIKVPAPEKNNIKRQIIKRTPEEIEIYRKDLLYTIQEINQLHSGELPIYRNPTSNCSWDCSFKNVCYDPVDYKLPT